MADEQTSQDERIWVLDPTGTPGSVLAGQLPAYLARGYKEAPPELAAEFAAKDTKLKKYGSVGQQVATVAEGLASGATLGLSELGERAFGVPAEDIGGRSEVNPVERFGSNLVGAAIPIALSGGAAAPEELAAAAAEKAAAETLAARAATEATEAAQNAKVFGDFAGNGERLAQEATAASARHVTAQTASEAASAKLAGLQPTPSIADYLPPSLASKLGGAAKELVAPAEEGAGALETFGRDLARRGLGAAAESVPYTAQNIAHEAAIGDPKLNGESAVAEFGVNAILTGGLFGLGGALAKAGGGAELPSWLGKEGLDEFSGTRFWKSIGATKGSFNSLRRSGRSWQEIAKRGNEAYDLGLIPASGITSAKQAFTRAGELEDWAVQEFMRPTIEAVDAKGGIAAKETQQFWNKAANDIAKPLLDEPINEPSGQYMETLIGKYKKKFEAGSTLEDFHSVRKALDTEIWGLKGSNEVQRDIKTEALYDLRSAISREINDVIDRAGESSPLWKQGNRLYSVAADVRRVADKAIAGKAGNNPVSLMEGVSGLAGLVRGGPLEGAITGLGTAILRRHSSGVLGAGARQLSRAIGPAAEAATEGVLPEALGASAQGIEAATGREGIAGIGNERFAPVGAQVEQDRGAAVRAQRDAQEASLRRGQADLSGIAPSSLRGHSSLDVETHRSAPPVSPGSGSMLDEYLSSRGITGHGYSEIPQELGSETEQLASTARGISPPYEVPGDVSVPRRTGVVGGQGRDAIDEAIEASRSRASGAEPLPQPTLQGPRSATEEMLYQAARNPEQDTALKGLKNTADKVQRKVQGGASTLVRMGPKAAKVARTEVIAGLSKVAALPQEDARTTYDKRTKQILTLARDPEALINAVADMTSDLREHAPLTSDAAGQAAQRAVAYLAQIVPTPPDRGPLGAPFVPSRAEIAKFNQTWDVLHDPTSILKQAAAGTLTAASVQAVQVVFPALYASIQQELLQQLAKHPQVSRESRIGLSLIMNADLDGSTRSLGSNQAAFAAKPSAPQQGQQQTRSGGAKNLSLGERSAPGIGASP